MKIVMDFRKYDGVVGGVERGVIQITRHVTAQGHQMLLLPKESRLEEVRSHFAESPNLSFRPLTVRSHIMSLRNLYLDSAVIQDIAHQWDADVVHFPYNWSFPLRKGAPTVLTVHDVIPLSYREAMGLLTNLFLYRPGMRLATRLNDVIATVSAFSKQDISQQLGVPLEKIEVIPNGLRAPHNPDPSLDAALDRRFGLHHDFVLYVGGIHERKNVVGLIQAFARLVQSTGFPGKLLLTGKVSGAPYQVKMKKLLDAVVKETDMEGRVIFTGFVSDPELDSLMRRAACLVYPSFYEGFGIPVLEAMQVGTPVITSDRTALPEVAGGAAMLVNPQSPQAMAASMAKLLHDNDLRTELIRKGKERAARYSWEQTASRYLSLYQRLGR